MEQLPYSTLVPGEVARYVHRVETSSIYIIAGKRFGEHCDIQIAIDYEMKFKNYFTSSFLFELVWIYSTVCVYHLPLNIHSHKSPWLSRLERHSSKPEVVGSNPAVGKNFSFCNSRSLRVGWHLKSVNTNEINRGIHLAYTLF